MRWEAWFLTGFFVVIWISGLHRFADPKAGTPPWKPSDIIIATATIASLIYFVVRLGVQ